ncbi:hypothetical protein SpCBS45565_g03934 [Spizellomyces sp. 'palustris']|nr:hypothetical protein SpCBS45565_g03934 [Spizellomyces sp. 'palustris']
MEYHPDRTIAKPIEERTQCNQTYILVQNAYAILSDTRKRAEYDYLIATRVAPVVSYTRAPTAAAGQPQAFWGDGQTPTNIGKIMTPWVIGLGAVWFVGTVLSMYVSEQQSRSEVEAWQEYMKAREQEGLADVLGYTRK